MSMERLLGRHITSLPDPTGARSMHLISKQDALGAVLVGVTNKVRKGGGEE